MRTDPLYFLKKPIWRGWVRFLIWRRDHVLRTLRA